MPSSTSFLILTLSGNKDSYRTESCSSDSVDSVIRATESPAPQIYDMIVRYTKATCGTCNLSWSCFSWNGQIIFFGVKETFRTTFFSIHQMIHWFGLVVYTRKLFWMSMSLQTKIINNNTSIPPKNKFYIRKFNYK